MKNKYKKIKRKANTDPLDTAKVVIKCLGEIRISFWPVVGFQGYGGAAEVHVNVDKYISF